MGTDQGARQAVENFSGEDPSVKATGNVREEGGGGIGSTRAGEKGLAQAWGLKDPSVARAMVKRAKRMRKFQNGEARRQKMKNPDVRFDVFAKNAGEHRTASGTAMSETGSVVSSTQRKQTVHTYSSVVCKNTLATCRLRAFGPLGHFAPFFLRWPCRQGRTILPTPSRA